MTVHYKSNDSDLAALMYRALKSGHEDKITHAKKTSEGLECLGEAAKILERLHEIKAAEAITVILEKLSGER